MKLVTFENAARQSRIGALVDRDRIVDLSIACAVYQNAVDGETNSERAAGALVPTDMRALFGGGDKGLDAARNALDYVQRLDSAASSAIGPSGKTIVYACSDVQLRAPIIPKKFFHTAGNFREHHEEATKAGFSHPVMPWIVFFQNTDAIIGPGAPVIYPEHLTEELDYELELAVVLKKAGKHFTAEEASDYIGGYVIFNDITARDIQRREMKSGVFSFCKGIDTFCPLGPWIVTADEIPDPHNLAMELRVNGESRQRSHSSKMSVTIPEILAHYSPMGYSAGDVVSTGTVSGVAAFSGDPKAWYLKPGDVMECEIEKIGVLRNPVISWEQAYGRRAPARASHG
jgi:2-keto-4-pentenoate hydratase/2-oxohepta-3-ene-1,7-dioic acid hydratase in catechol pathway